MKFLGGVESVSDTKRKEKENMSKNTEKHLSEITGEIVKEESPKGRDELPEITIESYLLGGYSLLFIRTDETERAVGVVKKAIGSIDMMRGSVVFGEWRVTTGLILCPKGKLEYGTSKKKSADSIIDSLQYVQKAREPHVVCFHNLRQFLQQPPVIQLVIDASYAARLVGSHIILVGSHSEVPPELQNLITVYDLELPNQQKFVENFKTFCAAYSSSLKEKVTDRTLEVAAAAAVGMTELQGENAAALSIAMEKRLSSTIVQLEKEQAIKRNDVLEFVHLTEAMKQLGGFKNLKRWIEKRDDSFSAEAIEYGLRFPKGVLLVGVPGTGKSLAARCIAHYFGLPLLKFDIGRVFRSLMGSSESSVRSALKTAEAVSPVVLWIEEIEKSMAGTQSSGQTDSGTTARVMGTILTWMQENRKPVFIVATANAVDSLPPELLRKGRFSEIWGSIEPVSIEREEIWRIHIGKVRPQKVDEFDYPALALASKGYTGAEIEGIVEEAMFDAWSDDRREMTTDDLINATGNIVPQAKTCEDKVKIIRSWMATKCRYVSGELEPEGEETQIDKTWRKVRAEAHTLENPQSQENTE